MINDSVFKTEWAVLCERFGKHFSAPVTSRYYQFLSARMDTEQFQAACVAVFVSNEFFPTPEDLARNVLGSSESDALGQWELCQRIMEGERHILDRMNPAGQRVVSLLGGVGRLGQTDVDKVAFLRRDFLQFYEDTIDADPVALLPEVTDESRRIVGEVLTKARLLNSGNQGDT